jgi:hypothetical protein
MASRVAGASIVAEIDNGCFRRAGLVPFRRESRWSLPIRSRRERPCPTSPPKARPTWATLSWTHFRQVPPRLETESAGRGGAARSTTCGTSLPRSPIPNDRATQEEEFSLELRTRDRERKLLKKINEAHGSDRKRRLRLLRGLRGGDRTAAHVGSPDRHLVYRLQNAGRNPRKAGLTARPLGPHGVLVIRSGRASVAEAPSQTPPHVPARGRFAPSPTGPLHFGSLVAALGSFLEARRRAASGGSASKTWTRPARVPGAADAILRALERYESALGWSGVYQSQRTEGYRGGPGAAVERRAGLPLHLQPAGTGHSPSRASDGGPIYPGHCRAGVRQPGRPAAIRLARDRHAAGFSGRRARRLTPSAWRARSAIS